MPMFFEIQVRVNGEEKYVDGHKVFKYLLQEYSKVNYKGKVIDPYTTRIDKFYSNIPQALLDTWKEAYPNVDIKQELMKCKAWLLSNTNKAKKDFRRFSNNWLAKAMQNGGQLPVDMSDKKLDQQIAKRKLYVKQAEEEAAPQEWVNDLLVDLKNKMTKK